MTTTTTLRVILTTILLLVPTTTLLLVGSEPLSESERLKEYRARNYKWPLEVLEPNTTGWHRRIKRRLAQVERVQNNRDRYNGWMAVMAAAISVPNFTENGWGLTRAPTELWEALNASLHEGLPKAKEENYINVIEGNKFERPLFVSQNRLNRRVLEELKPMHEEWAGIKLEGAMAYGLRVYQNNSHLNMHVDKVRTHIISCILHVDHSEDSEPWPIIIEDYQGYTNEVVLEAGDMLFYESSKCIHGRPTKLRGSWYSSIFVHYYPVGWDQDKADLETHYAIPPHWHTPSPLDPDLPEMTMLGTSMKEPGCKDQWCSLKDSVKWYGPSKEGVVITTGYKEDTEADASDEL